MLSMLFNQSVNYIFWYSPTSAVLIKNNCYYRFPGAKDIRQVPGKAEIAFVEFDTVAHATSAMETLQGFKIDPTHSIKIEYSKK